MTRLAMALLCLAVCTGYQPMIGPVILNATAVRIEIEAKFEDAHVAQAIVNPRNTAWLAYDQSTLIQLTVMKEGRELARLGADDLRAWQIDTNRKSPLTVAVRNSAVEKISYASLGAEVDRLKNLYKRKKKGR